MLAKSQRQLVVLDDINLRQVFGALLSHALSLLVPFLPIMAMGSNRIVSSFAMIMLCGTLGSVHAQVFSSTWFVLVGFVLGIPSMYLLCVVFCSPLWSLETVLFACLLAAMVVVPVVAATSCNRRHIRLLLAFFEVQSLKDAVALFPALGALVGAFCGAWALPLDWGTEWQVWPVPNAAGAIAGNFLGMVYATGYCIFLR